MRHHPRPPRTRTLLSALAATVLLAGCGAGSQVDAGATVACDITLPEQPTQVNILSYASPSTDAFAKAAASNCTRGELTVNVPTTDLAGQKQRAVQSLSAKKGSYDITEVFGTVYPLYADRGWIAPLDDFVDQRGEDLDLGDVDPTLMEALSYDGHQVAVPTFWGSIIMVYREDVLAEAGVEVPTTFDELAQASRQITEKTGMAHPLVLPYNASGDITTQYNAALNSTGGTWFDEATATPRLDSPQSVAALEAITSLTRVMAPEVMSYSSPEAITQLQTGQAAIGMLFSGRMSALVDPAQSTHADQFAFAPPPSVTAGAPMATSTSVDGLAVAANSAVDPELLHGVLGVATGAEAAQAASDVTIPARTAQARAAKLPFQAAARAVLDSGHPGGLPAVPYMADVFAAVAPAFASVASGQVSAEEGAARAQQLATDAIAAAGYGG